MEKKMEEEFKQTEAYKNSFNYALEKRDAAIRDFLQAIKEALHMNKLFSWIVRKVNQRI